MAFDPNLPANSALIVAAELRNQFNALKALFDALQAQVNGLLPVGSIVGWAKSRANIPALPGTWVECNGQVLNDPLSPFHGQVMDDINGAGGPQRFLRGASASGGTGGAEAHQHGLNYAVPFAVSSGADAFGATSNADVSDAAASLPSYYEVVWIIRVK